MFIVAPCFLDTYVALNYYFPCFCCSGLPDIHARQELSTRGAKDCKFYTRELYSFAPRSAQFLPGCWGDFNK